MVVGYLVRVPLKNDKNYSRTKRIRTKTGSVMKHSPGMPPGANTINPAVIEGGRHPDSLQMNVVYG